MYLLIIRMCDLFIYQIGLYRYTKLRTDKMTTMRSSQILGDCSYRRLRAAVAQGVFYLRIIARDPYLVLQGYMQKVLPFRSFAG